MKLRKNKKIDKLGTVYYYAYCDRSAKQIKNAILALEQE